MTPYDVLLGFADWWTKQSGFMLPPSQHDGVTFLKDFTGFVLYRGAPFQVQLWLCRPGSEIPDHSHPNIDTLVVYLSGEIYFRHNGEPTITAEHLGLDENGVCLRNPAVCGEAGIARVKPTDTHGATIGPLGGAFIVIQHWLNGVPGDTEMDWNGAPLDEHHAEQLSCLAMHGVASIPQ